MSGTLSNFRKVSDQHSYGIESDVVEADVYIHQEYRELAKQM